MIVWPFTTLLLNVGREDKKKRNFYADNGDSGDDDA